MKGVLLRPSLREIIATPQKAAKDEHLHFPSSTIVIASPQYYPILVAILIVSCHVLWL